LLVYLLFPRTLATALSRQPCQQRMPPQTAQRLFFSVQGTIWPSRKQAIYLSWLNFLTLTESFCSCEKRTSVQNLLPLIDTKLQCPEVLLPSATVSFSIPCTQSLHYIYLIISVLAYTLFMMVDIIVCSIATLSFQKCLTMGARKSILFVKYLDHIILHTSEWLKSSFCCGEVDRYPWDVAETKKRWSKIYK